MNQNRELFMRPIGLDFGSQELYFTIITEYHSQNVASLLGGSVTMEMYRFRLILKS